MADVPRTPPLHPLPNDRAFIPRASEEARSKDAERRTAIEDRIEAGKQPGTQHVETYLSNADKIELWEAMAQDMANAAGCAILLHYYALPHFERCNPTMRAAFIPSDENIAEVIEPPPELGVR